MRRRALLGLLVAGSIGALACTTKSTDSTFTPDPALAIDAGQTGDASESGNVARSFSFDPRSADRSCAVDYDCVIAEAIHDCMSCCGAAAVRRGEEVGYRAALNACRDAGRGHGSCTMGCPSAVPACVDGQCVTLDGTGGSCPGGDGGAGDMGPPAALGPGPACGATAVTTGFENGLDPSWPVTDPSAVRIENGALRIAYRQTAAYVTIPQPDACGVRLAFTVKTKLLARGLTLARIVAGDGNWFHIRLESCALSVGEVTSDNVAVGLSSSGELWPVQDDTPIRVVMTFDLANKTMTSTSAPVGEPLPAPKSTPLRGDPSGAGAIRAIELGAAPGVQNSGVGSVWIDDLQIE